MNLNDNDFALIEQALREGVNQGSDYQKVLAYQKVLSKLQGAADLEQARGAEQLKYSRYEYDGT